MDIRQQEDQAKHLGWLSNLQRQLAEVEALRSIYSGEGEFTMNPEEAAALEILTGLEEDAPLSKTLTVSFTIHLTSIELGGRHVTVVFSLPQHYPERKAVRVLVECGGAITRQQHEAINRTAREMADELVGEEAILQILQRVQEVAWEIQEARMEESLKESSSTSLLGRVSKTLKRTLIWFHHIKSLQKRKSIVEWGRELRLGGYCKPGFPGILVIEGGGDDVAQYLRRLQSLRWQALGVRGEEEEEVTCDQDMDALRRFSIGIRELNENAMSELGALCREANLESLFLSGLKISR